MCIEIFCSLVRDIGSFKNNPIFLIIVFKGLSVAKISLRPESALFLDGWITAAI